MQNNYILMGDVISSSEKDSMSLIDAFQTEVKRINDNLHYKKLIKSPLTITLGDEFQGVIKSLKASLSIIFALDLEFLQYDFDLRYALHYGEIEPYATMISFFKKISSLQ